MQRRASAGRGQHFAGVGATQGPEDGSGQLGMATAQVLKGKASPISGPLVDMCLELLEELMAASGG